MLFYFVKTFKMLKLILHFLLAFTSESFDILDTLDLLSPPVLRTPSKLNFVNISFNTLLNYEVGANPAKESSYPWIARVIHSRSADVPHICTAVCIEEAIFITAARCIYTLKVKYTSILYMSKRFEARVFVLPSKPTLQMFDDIGIIVVDTKTDHQLQWEVIDRYEVNRTDEKFEWFRKLNKEKKKTAYKVLGYTMKKGIHRLLSADTKYELTELNVVAAYDICSEVLAEHRKTKTEYYGFGVPCYHSCSLEQFREHKKKNITMCTKYHGVEGGALLANNKLIGIATWGTYYPKYELPVGFSAVNSENFFQDLTCARQIREDNENPKKKGYYQNYCDGN